MQTGIWETVADALFWMQLGWILSGFLLMAYLAFKVFPGTPKLNDVQEYGNAAGVDLDRDSESQAQSQDAPRGPVQTPYRFGFKSGIILNKNKH